MKLQVTLFIIIFSLFASSVYYIGFVYHKIDDIIIAIFIGFLGTMLMILIPSLIIFLCLIIVHQITEY
jgi:hypothetical protein